MTCAIPEYAQCRRCREFVAVDQIVVREIPWEDGGQSGTEEVEVCASCADAIDRKVA